MKGQKIIGYVLSGIAGGAAAHFGGVGAVIAVIMGELALIVLLS